MGINMADIELVIKIPEEIYSRILERNRIHAHEWDDFYRSR